MKFVFDLDGTICFKGKPISETILLSLKELLNWGHEVLFASARPIRDMLPVIPKELHECPLIGGNGSLIFYKGRMVHKSTFSTELIQEISALFDKYEAAYLIDGEWNYAYTGPKDHPILKNVDPGHLAEKVPLDQLESIVKILILSSNHYRHFSEELAQLDVYVNRHSHENVLDISPKEVNKWTALQTLGMQAQSYIAFGNDANDLPMFQSALHTIMIGYHKGLANLANESIPLQGSLEQRIAEKIIELGQMNAGYRYYDDNVHLLE